MHALLWFTTCAITVLSGNNYLSQGKQNRICYMNDCDKGAQSDTTIIYCDAYTPSCLIHHVDVVRIVNTYIAQVSSSFSLPVDTLH